MEITEALEPHLGIWQDKRLTIRHLGMYLAFVHLWKQNGRKNPITISRRKVMQLARIKGLPTYHKCVRELVEFGYIEYRPTYDYYTGTKVVVKNYV